MSTKIGKNPTLWKIACQEDRYPGMWQRWFENQCVAVGWPSKSGYKLHERTKKKGGWNRARNEIQRMKVGDKIIVALRNNRVGRLGEITKIAINDDQWDPIISDKIKPPFGEMGRRIFVRWELNIGPRDSDLIIQLPEDCRFTDGELRPTVSKINSQNYSRICQVMKDPENWVGLLGKFVYERALSDYIANYPSRLEDGLYPYPDFHIQEHVFPDKTRLDVLLIDEREQPVIIECKQHAPTVKDINQLCQYMAWLEKEISKKPRGILVHGGAQKLTKVINREAKKAQIEIVSYRIMVDFAQCL